MKNRPFLLALPFGVLTLVLALTMPSIPAAPEVLNPIVELEFARSAADISKVLAGGEEVRLAVIRNVWADTFFLLAYSAFLMVSCLLANRFDRKPWLWLGVALSLAAAIFDHLENRQLLEIMGSEDIHWAEFLSPLALFTWLKWGSIVVVFLLLGWFMKTQNTFGKVFFGMAALTAGFAVVTGFLPGLATYFALLVAGLFLLLFLWEIFFSYSFKVTSE